MHVSAHFPGKLAAVWRPAAGRGRRFADVGVRSGKKCAKLGPPAGLRPAGDPILALTLQKSEQNPVRERYFSENFVSMKS